MTLLEVVRRLIEGLYDLPAATDVSRYIVGDAGYRRFYGATRTLHRGDRGTWGEASVLLRLEGDRARIALYYPDALIEGLERRHPFRGVDDGNVDAFSVFIEELDHFLHILFKLRRQVAFSLLELETLGFVSKYLVARHFLRRQVGVKDGRGRLRLRPFDRMWLWHRIFEAPAYDERDPAVHDRYRRAARFAARFLLAIETRDPDQALAQLRQFQRLDHHGKLAYLREVA